MAARNDSQKPAAELNHLQALDSVLLPCLHCGYDLRGSPEQGVCPECGESFRRGQLYQDVIRQRFRDILFDVKFVFYGGLVVVGGCFFFLGISFLMADRGNGFFSGVGINLVILMGMLFVFLVVLYLICWFRLMRQMWWRHTVFWSQVKGIGLLKDLLLAGAVLLVPLILAGLLV